MQHLHIGRPVVTRKRVDLLGQRAAARRSALRVAALAWPEPRHVPILVAQRRLSPVISLFNSASQTIAATAQSYAATLAFSLISGFHISPSPLGV